MHTILVDIYFVCLEFSLQTRKILAGFDVIITLHINALIYFDHGMQQPISEANLEVIFRDFVSQNLVNWFLNPVSKMIFLHLSNQLVIFFVNIDVYFKSSEFWSSLLIIKAWVLTRSELAGFEVCRCIFKYV